MQREKVVGKIVVFGLLFIALAGHELAHGLKMYQYGIPVETIYIGWPLIDAPLLTIQLTDSTKLVVEPLLLGAAVAPSEIGAEQIKTLPFSKRIDIAASGILFGLFLGGLLVTLHLKIRQVPDYKIGIVITSTTVVASITLLVIPKPITAACSAVLVILLNFEGIFMNKFAHEIRNLYALAVESQSRLIGPITIIRELGRQSSNVIEGLGTAGRMIILVAIFNCIPIYMFDGGKILILSISYLTHLPEITVVRGSAAVFALLCLAGIIITLAAIVKLFRKKNT